MSKKQIRVMSTPFRDGFQSAYGARVLTKDFMPAVKAACDAGINYFESGGGARFQSLFFYCNENAFDMMDEFRRTVGPDVELQTLARGINVVGLESQSSDVIELHARLFKKHGVTTIRNFDALNDVNNLIYSGKCIVDAGLKHQIVVTMMELPPGCEGAHTPEFYNDVLKQILDAEIKFDSICFKDASGTSTPKKVFETIKLARASLPADIDIIFHSHDTAGICINAYKAAIDAGANGLDLSMAPVSGGTCQPDIITMWHALRGTDYDLGIDIDKLVIAEEIFKDCMKDYFLPPEASKVDPMIVFSPMPGGALTANTQMMRDNNMLDKFPQVIKAMSEVVRRGGFGTSVTPVSQFYFQQALNNVIFGPWEKIADGYGKMVLGYFGKTPIAPDAEIVKLAAEQLKMEPTKECPLKLNDADPNKGLEHARKQLQQAKLEETDENLFIAATCGEKGITYLKGDAKVNVSKIDSSANGNQLANKANGSSGCAVTVNNKTYEVVIDGDKAVVNGKTYDIKIGELSSTGKSSSGSRGQNHDVSSPMPGTVLKVLVSEGQNVEINETLFILEAMKMETEVKASVAGKVSDIAIAQGDQVAAGQTIAVIH